MAQPDIYKQYIALIDYRQRKLGKEIYEMNIQLQKCRVKL